MNLFDTSPSELPPHAGVPVSALTMPTDELETPPRIGAALKKFSASRIRMGENEARWADEAHEELLRQHPWLSTYTLSSEMTSTTPDGYGVGFFRVTPSNVAAAIAGPEVVNVVTVPIIVRDFRLYPFDLFGHEDQLFPLTEDRVVPIIRLRDAFTEVDRDFSRLNLKRTTGAGIGTGRGFFSGAFKGSTADVREKVSTLVDACAAVLDAAPTEESFAGPTVFDGIQEKISSFARPCGAEIIVGKDITYRMAWASDLVTGDPSEEPLQKTSMHELREIFGEDVVREALSSRHVVVNLNDDDPAALAHLLADGAEKTSGGSMSPVACSSSFNKVSAPGPASVQRFLVVPKDKYEMEEPREFTGVSVHKYEAAGSMGGHGSNGVLGVIDQEGWFLEAHEWDSSRNLYSLETIPFSGTTTPVGVKRLNGQACDTSYALWQQGGTVYGVRIGPHSVAAADGTYWPVLERHGDNYGTLVRISPDFQTAYMELKGDTHVLNLPMNAWIVAPAGPQKPGAPFSVESGAGEQPQLPQMGGAQLPMGQEMPPEMAQELPPMPNDVKVSFDGVRYYANIGKEVTSGNRQQVEFRLAAAGVPGRLSNVLMDSCSLAGKDASASFRSPHHGEGAAFAKAASARVRGRLESAGSAPREARALAQWIPANIDGEMLKASGVDGAAVDTVLALGFLNEDNLLRYVDMAPTFEKSMSYLCSLLMASRLGLDEVPEPSVEAAIRGTDKILSALRVVEYALTS